jgi:hypothetical protein
VCKQIYAEIKGLVYKENAFVFDKNQYFSLALEGSCMHHFIPSPVFNRIRHAQVEFDFRRLWDFWDVHRHLTQIVWKYFCLTATIKERDKVIAGFSRA